MQIDWDEEKNQKLIATRSVSFEDATRCILEGRISEVTKNSSRSGQYCFVLMLNKYAHVVPFVVTEEGNIFLKTIFPSRKFQKRYG